MFDHLLLSQGITRRTRQALDEERPRVAPGLERAGVIPGEVLPEAGEILLNQDRATIALTVAKPVTVRFRWAVTFISPRRILRWPSIGTRR